MESIKQKIAQIMKQHAVVDGDDDHHLESKDALRLLLPPKTKDEDAANTVLEDSDTAESLELDSNAVLYVVLRVADNEYEAVDIRSTDMDE